MNNTECFLKHLSLFENTLNMYGYFKSHIDGKQLTNYKENVSVIFINPAINQKIYLDYILWRKGHIVLSVSMFKIPKDNTFFDLLWFLEKHGLEDKISCKLEAGGDFDDFAKKFFEDLAVLFANELNDQITGKSFENHWEALKKSMDEY